MASNADNFLTMLNAATFASTKLTESNFNLRKEQIICLLESHDLIGFVDGTIAEPSTEQAGYMRWKKSDRLVKGWILGCLSDEMLGTVTNKATARDVWVALEADTAQNNEGPMTSTSTTVVSNDDIYFSNLSTVNAANFISVKLTSESNFEQWEAQIRCLLRTQGLVGHIDSTDQSKNEAERLSWQRTDSFVKGWILGSLSEEILKKVANETTARDVWVALKEDGWIPKYGWVPNAELFSNLSSVNTSNFVSIKLASQSNFNQWKEQMKCLLESQNLYDFVVGANQETKKEDDYWRSKIDKIVTGWIMGSLSEDILNKLISLLQAGDISTARDIWVAVDKEICPEAVGDNKDYSRYLPLYKASQCGDWKKAEAFLNRDQQACRAPLNIFKQTALHIAVGVTSDKGKHFVEKLVGILTNEDLAMKDYGGLTPLHYAAKFGNLHAAKILLSRDPNLPHVASSKDSLFPIHNAAEYGNISTDVYEYFLSVTLHPYCYTHNRGFWLFHKLIHSSLYDFARELVERYPGLAEYELDEEYALKELAMMEFTFISGSHLNSWQQLLYYCVPIRSTSRGHLGRANANDLERQNANDMENEPNARWLSSICNKVYFRTVIKKLVSLPFEVLENFVPSLKHIRDKKMMHHSAVELAECLFRKMENPNDRDGNDCFAPIRINSIITSAIFEAARCGTYELVEMIVKRFTSSVFTFDGDGKSIFHIAIENRCENVFNLVYEISESRHHLMILQDRSGNTMLHSAAKLAQQDKLNLIPGAALQMQRELQWFEEVKKLMPSSSRKLENKNGKLAELLFIEEHKELKEAGEKWMKETATSLTISAALIATIAFAAAITVPGGNDGGTGLPIFSRNSAFVIFFISNVISLFASTTSLLVFLSVFTSRYRPEDFLQSLPRRLVMGLFFLFVSITGMMVSFSATVYVVFGQKKAWMLISVATMAFLPITSFVLLQLPLLVTLFSNTYGRGIFGKRILEYIKELFSRMTVSIKKTCESCSPLRVWHFWKVLRGWHYWKDNCGRPLR